MTTDLESEISPETTTKAKRPFSWLRVGAFAAGSALAGGLAFAWHYRKTLAQLREAETQSQDSDFRRPRDGSDSDD